MLSILARPMAVFVLLICLAVLAAPTGAQTPDQRGGDGSAFARVSAQWTTILEEAERYLEGGGGAPEETARLRGLLGKVRTEALAQRDTLRQELGKAEALLETIGPPPPADAPPEPDDIQAERQRYQSAIATLRSQVAQAELAASRAQSLDDSLSSLTRERMVEEIMEPRPAPLMPAVVAQAVPEFAQVVGTVLASPVEWYGSLDEGERDRLALWRLGLTVLFAILAGWLARRWLLEAFGPDPAVEQPSYTRRLVAAVADGVARGIVPALILAAFLVWVRRPGSVIDGLFGDVVQAGLLAGMFLVVAFALPRAALAPEPEAWRLTALPADRAQLVNRILRTLAIVLAADLFIQVSVRGLTISPELESLYLAVISVPEALGLLLLARSRLWRTGEDAESDEDDESEPDQDPVLAPEDGAEAIEAKARGGVWVLFRRTVALATIGALLAMIVGYVGIGRFIVERLLVTGVIFGAMVLVRGTVRDVIDAAFQAARLHARIGLRRRTVQRLAFWIRAGLDPLLLLAAVFAAAPLWGVPQEDLMRWSVALFRGFTVGNISISPGEILAAFLAFFGVMAVTRFVQQKMQSTVLPQTRLHPSVQHSLAAGMGYVGVIVAAALSIAVVGIDLTSIALVAGALSVGIGFGLQNIVNNFVSGLILLVERPVAVGDWVVVGSMEGIVKRVSFRATELETWQRASVIIPNAEILSSPVINWTHKDRYGRIEVAIGVAYGSDTDRVRELLLQAAREHPRVVAFPAPYVLFQDFGASSLDFELRCYTNVVTDKLSIASDLRFVIDSAFRAEGISIPFPQRVVHMADAQGEGD